MIAIAKKVPSTPCGLFGQIGSFLYNFKRVQSHHVCTLSYQKVALTRHYGKNKSKKLVIDKWININERHQRNFQVMRNISRHSQRETYILTWPPFSISPGRVTFLASIEAIFSPSLSRGMIWNSCCYWLPPTTFCYGFEIIFQLSVISSQWAAERPLLKCLSGSSIWHDDCLACILHIVLVDLEGPKEVLLWMREKPKA